MPVLPQGNLNPWDNFTLVTPFPSTKHKAPTDQCPTRRRLCPPRSGDYLVDVTDRADHFGSLDGRISGKLPELLSHFYMWNNPRGITPNHGCCNTNTVALMKWDDSKHVRPPKKKGNPMKAHQKTKLKTPKNPRKLQHTPRAHPRQSTVRQLWKESRLIACW